MTWLWFGDAKFQRGRKEGWDARAELAAREIAKAEADGYARGCAATREEIARDRSAAAKEGAKTRKQNRLDAALDARHGMDSGEARDG